MLPEPMLSRSAPLLRGPGWSFEVKWDGFRALVSTEDELRVRSRRGWNMTPALPELARVPAGLVLDGELVAFNRHGDPHFPLLCRRMLNFDQTVPVRLMVFDVLRADGEDTARLSYAKRRALLEQLDLNGSHWSTPDVFDDGEALYEAVCERGLEGVVAKWRRASYRPGVRGWVKVKNPDYWRRDEERESIARSRERGGNSRPELVY